jgi:hypothetical protein
MSVTLVTDPISVLCIWLFRISKLMCAVKQDVSLCLAKDYFCNFLKLRGLSTGSNCFGNKLNAVSGVFL